MCWLLPNNIILIWKYLVYATKLKQTSNGKMKWAVHKKEDIKWSEVIVHSHKLKCSLHFLICIAMWTKINWTKRDCKFYSVDYSIFQCKKVFNEFSYKFIVIFYTIIKCLKVFHSIYCLSFLSFFFFFSSQFYSFWTIKYNTSVKLSTIIIYLFFFFPSKLFQTFV